VPVSSKRPPVLGVSKQSLAYILSACHHKLIKMEAPPNSVQLISQIRLLSSAFDEFPHYLDVVFFAWFKTIAIVKNKPIVLC
jgi:hypothetical protein